MRKRIRSLIDGTERRARALGRSLWRPVAWLIAEVRDLELRDWFLICGVSLLGYGIDGFDRRVAAIVVGILLLYLGLWHRGVKRGSAQ